MTEHFWVTLTLQDNFFTVYVGILYLRDYFYLHTIRTSWINWFINSSPHTWILILSNPRHGLYLDYNIMTISTSSGCAVAELLSWRSQVQVPPLVWCFKQSEKLFVVCILFWHHEWTQLYENILLLYESKRILSYKVPPSNYLFYSNKNDHSESIVSSAQIRGVSLLDTFRGKLPNRDKAQGFRQKIIIKKPL